jgi:hypothetical protein
MPDDFKVDYTVNSLLGFSAHVSRNQVVHLDYTEESKFARREHAAAQPLLKTALFDVTMIPSNLILNQVPARGMQNLVV